MRILNRQQFLAMPRGTVYANYRPMITDGLCIKGSTQGNDWFFDDLCPLGSIDADSSEQLADWTDKMLKTGCSKPADFNYTDRDGSFDDKALFMIYEPADVAKLIRRLSEALEGK